VGFAVALMGLVILAIVLAMFGVYGWASLSTLRNTQHKEEIVFRILIVAAIVMFALASTAAAQNVRTYKSNFPGFCTPGPTAY
jgi:membrane protein DedA with SNARE-associated domain